MAALRFCGVTPALARILPASLSFSSAMREQQPLDGDEAVAGLLRDLLGVVEQPRGRGCEIDLAGARRPTPSASCRAPLRRRPAPARELPPERSIRPGGQPFRVVEQDLEHVLGGELLMALAQREGLRGLDETARAVGVFLDIHASLPRAQAASARTTDLTLSVRPAQDVRSRLPSRKGGRA